MHDLSCRLGADERLSLAPLARWKLRYALRMAGWRLSLDTTTADAIPYFNWDAPVTNAAVRRALSEGTEDDKIYWMARILREARYADVWSYLNLRNDVLPRWDRLRSQLGRQRAFWEFLIGHWRDHELI